MGIEAIVIVGVLIVLGGIIAYVYSRPSKSGDGLSEPLATYGSSPDTTAEPEKKRKKDSSSPGRSASPSAPSQPSMGSNSDDRWDSAIGSTGGWVSGSDVEEMDGFADYDDDEIEEESSEPEPLEPSIEDTQTMKAVLPKDTQEIKEIVNESPKEMMPDEIVEWMDEIATEGAEAIGGLPSMKFEDVLSDKELDIKYPEKKEEASALATKAHFSAFYPKEAEAGQRYGVYIYAHAEAMLEQITNDAQKFKTELGGNIPQPRTAKTAKTLEHGTKITVLLESEEVEFEPDMLTKRWHGDWTRYEFEFRPDADLIDESVFVRASIMVMGFEIAKIKFAIDITAPQMQVMSRMADSDDAPSNPFAKAKLESATTNGYDKIFISYSRKDKLIAEAFKIIQEAAGNDVFFDVDDIRTGEDWQAAIARAIDEADYLQLFWSENSANSEWCGYEWEYALNYRCQENKCREFIRPVWWIAPMPPPPNTLGHLNFRRMDFEKLMQRDD